MLASNAYIFKFYCQESNLCPSLCPFNKIRITDNINQVVRFNSIPALVPNMGSELCKENHEPAC